MVICKTSLFASTYMFILTFVFIGYIAYQ
uniref:Uncharacterized protein n=1 Tax=Nelumbo nucifera TaxID=4432 RepID=A0A822XW30_NELNU|nr:TPA_asm: hypothetical protein HUJ06_024448 [Nelumbo nucifera]